MCVAPGETRRFRFPEAHNREAVELRFLRYYLEFPSLGYEWIQPHPRLAYAPTRFLRVSPGAMHIYALRASATQFSSLFDELGHNAHGDFGDRLRSNPKPNRADYTL